MTEQKEDMILLWAKSILNITLIVLMLYFANYVAFEAAAIKGESVGWLVMHLLHFLALIGLSLVLILRVYGLCADMCIENSRKMLSGAADVFRCSVLFVLGYAMTHLVNIFGGWASFDMEALTGGKVLTMSLLFSTVVCLLSFVYGRLSKKGCKR